MGEVVMGGERRELGNRRQISDNQIVSQISATEASKRFADVLDAVEHRGETFTVVRRGRIVATIAPARNGTGADLRRILAEHPPDDQWADDLRDLRRLAGEAPVNDPWND
jgi:prevent-host-death family protein